MFWTIFFFNLPEKREHLVQFEEDGACLVEKID